MNTDDDHEDDAVVCSNDTSSSRPSRPDAAPSSSSSLAAHQEFNQIVFRFEDAWQNEGRPEIADFLPAAGPLRLIVLQELVRIDFEYRCNQQEQPVATEYLERYPELAADDGELQSLMNWFGQQSANTRDHSTTGRDQGQESAYWSSIRPGTVLGNYTILEKLGQGGMGAVFKARHQHMNRIVALKTISPQVMRSAEAVKRFHREVRAAARLDHPNIITAYDADKFGNIHVLIMQYVEGSDLSTLVRNQGPLSIADAVQCLAQAASGLDYAHLHGIIHRDIKPANLIRDRAGQLKILDMGLARTADSLAGEESHELTMTGEIVGTADFMAPEQALDAKNASRQADIYSLGCTLYYLLTGSSMFSGGSYFKKLLAHRETPIPRLKLMRSDVPDWLETVFQRMVAKQSEDRFQTMSELLAAVSAKGGSAEQSASPALELAPVRAELPDFSGIESARRSATRPAKSQAPNWRVWAAVAGTMLVLVVAFVIQRQFAAKPAAANSLAASSTSKSQPASDATTHVISDQVAPASVPSDPTASQASKPAVGPSTSLSVMLNPISVTDIASDSRYSLLVGNGILLSPDNALFEDSDRETIEKFQAGFQTSQSALTLFFAGRFEVPSGWASCRVQNVSPETCLTAWVIFRDGQQAERLDAGLADRDVVIEVKGASAISIFVTTFAKNEASAEYLGSRGLACKILPIKK
jgi:serine/threonine protein kinase